MPALIAALTLLMAWSTMFKNGLYGGSFFNSLFAAGTGGLLCADVLSFINMTSSSRSRLSLVCLKKSAKHSQFILPRKAVGNTSPAFANTATHTVMFHPLCPQTCLHMLFHLLWTSPHYEWSEHCNCTH